MLIELVMARYGSRPSVIGFGVDVEWYRKDITRDGKAVTDAEAQDWVVRTTAARAGALVFLKHWLASKMPPTARNGLVFIDDSQGHGSLDNLVNEFRAFGQAFAPAPVGFQFGYRSDKKWWSKLPGDPPTVIGNAPGCPGAVDQNGETSSFGLGCRRGRRSRWGGAAVAGQRRRGHRRRRHLGARARAAAGSASAPR